MEKKISAKIKKIFDKSKDPIIVKSYQIICHFYSVSTTFIEDIFFRVNQPSLDIKNRGFFKFKNNTCNFDIFVIMLNYPIFVQMVC